MNKKGLYFATLTIGIIMVFVIGYNIDRIVREKNVALDKIGVSAVSTINSFYEGERVKYFVDEAAEYSTLRALDLMGESGGLYDKTNCDEINNYIVWKENCQPDNLNENFEKYFNDTFEEYLSGLGLELNDFDIDIEGNLVVEGKAKEKFKIDISGISKIEISDIKVNERKIYTTLENLNDYMNIIREYSYKYDVPETLVLAVITQESGGDINAISEAGCHGLMQICPGPHPEYFDNNNDNFKCNARNSVECNIEAGTEILRRYYNQWGVRGINFKCDKFCDENDVCQGPVNNIYYDWEAALRAYHGLGCGGYPDYTYVEKVIKWYELLGGEEIKKISVKIGSYDIKPDFEVKISYNFEDYNEIKRAAQNCLENDECIGTNNYNLIENYPIGNIRIFEFESKEEIANIKPVVIKFALPVET